MARSASQSKACLPLSSLMSLFSISNYDVALTCREKGSVLHSDDKLVSTNTSSILAALLPSGQDEGLIISQWPEERDP